MFVGLSSRLPEWGRKEFFRKRIWIIGSNGTEKIAVRVQFSERTCWSGLKELGLRY